MNAKTHSRWLLFGALGFVALLPGPLLAETEESPADHRFTENFGAAPVAADALLDDARGGAELNLYDIKSDGVVTNNQAANLTTGSNWVTEGSFAGAAGFATVVQNSGNNVLIQNATIINLQVQ